MVVSTLITVKTGPKLVFRQVSQRLPVDRFERSFIHFVMQGNGEGLPGATGEQAAQFNVAAPLGFDLESAEREDFDDIATRGVLSFGIRERLKFEAGEDGRVRGEVELRQIFALEVKSERFLEISCQLVQGSPLGYDGKIKALRHILLFPLRDAHLDNLFHVHMPSVPQHSSLAN